MTQKQYAFLATLKKVSSDEDGEGTVIITVPMTEMSKITGLNMECKRILSVAVVVE